MPRVRGRSPVTFAVSPDLLVMIDAHAQTEGLDRYDVMRMAIAKGLVVMRFERELLMERSGTYARAVMKAVEAEGDPVEHAQMITDTVTKGFERDYPAGPNSVKMPRAKKVKANV